MRRAAELLHITHSGLSKSVKVLEAELCEQLIIRDGRGFVLTAPTAPCPGWVDGCQLVQPLQRRFEFEKAIHLFAAIHLPLQASAGLLRLNLR